MLRTSRIVVAVLAATLAVGVASASAADWVGLGDSYAAGPLIPDQQLDPLGCLRSNHNFAHLAPRSSASRSPTSRAAARRPTT
jgi:hypothetical protein